MRATWIVAVVVVIAAGIAVYSVDGVGSAASNSTSTSSSSSSTTQSSAVQYPLVWAPSPLSVCEASAFCINATLGFSGQQMTDTGTSVSVTSTVEDNATFIVRGFTTTVIRSGQTYANYVVDAAAFIQDAATGQNATGPNGIPLIGSSCTISPTGFTHCLVGAPYLPSVPSGHAYKVTVFVRGVSSLPCLSMPCPSNTMAQQSQLLAPPSPPLIVPAGTWGTTSNSSTTQSSTTSTSTASSYPSCGAPMNTLLNPAPKGTVYMKVVTDQGELITNGTLAVTQVGNTTGRWVTSGLEAHYCISLSDVNGTGYIQLAGNETFLASGYYNVTLAAGYNQGAGYLATIPSIQVHPNSTTYVTVSVPSGVVTVVTSNEGSSAVTTTTTSATTTKNDG
jgi:hypothetical protein